MEINRKKMKFNTCQIEVIDAIQRLSSHRLHRYSPNYEFLKIITVMFPKILILISNYNNHPIILSKFVTGLL